MGQVPSTEEFRNSGSNAFRVWTQNVLSDIEDEIKAVGEYLDTLAKKKEVTQKDAEDLKHRLSTGEQRLLDRIKYFNLGNETKIHYLGTSGSLPSKNMPMEEVIDKINEECSRWLTVIENLKQDKELSSEYVIMEMETTKKILHELANANIRATRYKTSPSDLKIPQSTSKSGSVHGEEGSSKDRIQKLEQENKELKGRLREAIKTNKRHKGKAMSKGDEYEYETITHDTTMDYLNKTKKESSERDKEYMKQIQILTGRQRDLLLRLSKATSEKLTENNPTIADLSDMNRPTKLGEEYNELYDNEWTDAYDALTKYGHRDRNIIETLKTTLMATFYFCEENSLLIIEKVNVAVNLDFDKKLTLKTSTEKQAKHQENTCWQPRIGQVDPEQIEMGKHSVDVSPKIRQLQKEVAVTMLPVVQKKFIDLMWDEECVPAMKPFIKKCLHLCWMMIVQSPPMCFAADPKPGELLDINLYKKYLSSEKFVDYTVWPALLLHKDGSLVCKGIVQPTTKST